MVATCLLVTPATARVRLVCNGSSNRCPQGAAYNKDVGQFLIDYDTIRAAASPDDALIAFMQATYEAAANNAKWDRAALER